MEVITQECRCGKSCRLRWINYLRADLKRGNITAEEEDTIIKLHASLGNRWSLIAGHLPGRTDNEIKNYWNSHLCRRIHSITGPTSEALSTYTNAAKMYGTCKRRSGRTSRSSMNKNKKITSSNIQISTAKGKAVLPIEVIGQGEQREHMDVESLHPKKEGEGRERIGVQGSCTGNRVKLLGHCDDRQSVFLCNGKEITSAVGLCPSKEGENGVLEPFEGLDVEITCLDYLLENEVSNPSGILGLRERREDGFMGSAQVTKSDERESGVWNSNTESGERYTSSSTMSDEWIDWDWESAVWGHKLWDGGEMLSCLWDGSNGKGMPILKTNAVI
ncbi:hypothetical protein L1049_017370 [Liquidambar formosana]|uniref:Uncharacterized protein n=1 Tax=Liquidambar formosana TaxID=63359 RepID=A0AAP0S7V6_LIQFO